jgi:hypothetical protein
MRKMVWPYIGMGVGAINIIGGVVNHNWLDLIGGLLILGVGSTSYSRGKKADRNPPQGS